jgi:hypothetical protein
MLTLGGGHAFHGRAAGPGAPQQSIAIESWSWGAGIVAPRDLASGQASGRRKCWDGTVKGGASVAETSNAAKFGAISGIKRNDRMTEPAARTIPPPVNGSVTVAGDFPGCTVGAHYAGAVLEAPGARYELSDIQIASCPIPAGAARSSLAGEYAGQTLSLNYKKVTVRGWDSAKEEE